MHGLSVKYWWKLNNNCYKGINSLVINALGDNRKLSDSSIYTWSTGIKKVLHLIGRLDIWERPLLITPNSFSTTIMDAITNFYYDRLWCDNINKVQSKLRTYCLFKNQFCLENYVSMFSCQYRSVFTKLRISAHPLMIEKGRHFHPKIPVDQRAYLYYICSLNEVEDELHFMLKCTYYADLRDTVFKYF